jgi:hypothetical protein
VRYFKRPWAEPRGDQHSNWGTSTWFFEIADDGYVARQIEVYEGGVALKYDESHLEDSYGGLSEGTLDLERDGFLPFEIAAPEFEQAWTTMKALNR